MAIGFISIHRALKDWQWYKFQNHKGVFIHCLLSANFKDAAHGRTIVKRGEFLTSKVILSDELGLCRNTINKVLVELQKTGELKVKSSNLGTRISVVKYNSYQSSGSLDEHGMNNKMNNKVNNNMTPSNKGNKGNKDNKGKTSKFDLDLIYAEFPRKEGKASGFKKLTSIIKSQELYNKIMLGAKKYHNHIKATGTEKQFTKQFSTWVNQRCWEDEIGDVKEVKDTFADELKSKEYQQ